MTATFTKGNETKALLLFSIPMILGNMLQQLYNVVDTLIVGRTLGPNALAAVGASYALMVLLTSIIIGLCMGSGVVFAQLFGARRIEELKMYMVRYSNRVDYSRYNRYFIWGSKKREVVSYRTFRRIGVK